jgi:RNA polymerase sigma-70 factor, ECF subfamily
MTGDEIFAEIVRDTHTGLRFYIRSLGVRSAWVDDITQDTYLLAYKRRKDLDDPANAIFWLRAIARNLVMNELSKNSRRQRLLDENLTTLLIESEDRLPDHTTLGDRTEIQTALIQCMQDLTERTRKVVEARYFKDRNSTQIGADLKMSPTAVRKILFNARKTLSICLRSHSIQATEL